MSQIIPIYIPTFISDATYAPARVLPHVYFFNGTLQCEQYYIQDENGAPRAQNAFPYFDNYNVVSGSFPSKKSRSLLFNNEAPSYGTIPNQNLYTEYWETYVNLLYNPYTRLLTCEAIIPLADYFKMELNDVVNFRGNYYHLRAINDYSLKTGECQLQLLGPIIPNTISDAGELPPPEASSSISWSYTESSQNGTFIVYDNESAIATLTANGTGSASVLQYNYVTASLTPVGYPSSGSVTMSLNVNGGTTISTTAYTNTTLTASFLVGSGSTYDITGSIQFNESPPGEFTLDAQYGMNITDVVSSTGTMPSFTFPQNSGDSQQILDMVSAFSPGNQFEVTLSGTRTPAGDKSVNVYVNSVLQDCETISADGGQTKYLIVTPGISIGDNVRISIASSAC